MQSLALLSPQWILRPALYNDGYCHYVIALVQKRYCLWPWLQSLYKSYSVGIKAVSFIFIYIFCFKESKTADIRVMSLEDIRPVIHVELHL